MHGRNAERLQFSLCCGMARSQKYGIQEIDYIYSRIRIRNQFKSIRVEMYRTGRRKTLDRSTETRGRSVSGADETEI